jgi:outer membrane lipoprotein-sorting protein
MFRLTIIIFLLYSFSQDSVYGQTIKTLTIDFIRSETEKTGEEIVKGKIYYQSPKRIILKATEPISQWMIFKDDTMLIYYPNEQKAFRFISKNPFSLPFFQALLGFTEEDYEFSKAGFKLARHELKQDTLLSYWDPPEKLRKILGNTIIGLVNDKLVVIEIHDAKDKILTKTTYSNHFRYGKNFLPLEITSVTYQKNSNIVEKVVYTNPQFNVPLPQDVVNFKIPANAEIKEIEW